MTNRSREPTEQATPKRLKQALEKGEIAYSRKLGPTLHFLMFCMLVLVFVQSTALSLARFAIAAFSLQVPVNKALAEAFFVLLDMLWPFLALAFVFSLVAGLVQTGVRFNWRLVRPDVSRISLSHGFRRMTSGKLADLGWALPFLVLFLGLVAFSLWIHRARIFALGFETGLSRGLESAAGLFRTLLWFQFFLLAAFCALDIVLVVSRHRKRLMMTKEEVTEEYRQTEGDPRTKQERRGIFEQWLAGAPEHVLVQEAKMLIVNPEHLAIAIGVDEDNSPVVLARGKGEKAHRFRRIANRAGVPVVRDVRLARELEKLPEDARIQGELLEALAVLFVELGLAED